MKSQQNEQELQQLNDTQQDDEEIATSTKKRTDVKWLCRIVDAISIALYVAIVLLIILAIIVVGGSALVGYLVNKYFYVAMIPGAALTLWAAYMTYDLKDDVDTVSGVLKKIKRHLETPEDESGLGHAVMKSAFVGLKESVVSSAKKMIIGPAVVAIVIGVVGTATGGCFLGIVGNNNHTIWIICIVVIVLTGTSFILGLPSLCISYIIFNSFRKDIEAMADQIEQMFVSEFFPNDSAFTQPERDVV